MYWAQGNHQRQSSRWLSLSGKLCALTNEEAPPLASAGMFQRICWKHCSSVTGVWGGGTVINDSSTKEDALEDPLPKVESSDMFWYGKITGVDSQLAASS